MLHNEARNLLVEAYEKARDSKEIDEQPALVSFSSLGGSGDFFSPPGTGIPGPAALASISAFAVSLPSSAGGLLKEPERGLASLFAILGPSFDDLFAKNVSQIETH